MFTHRPGFRSLGSRLAEKAMVIKGEPRGGGMLGCC